MKIAFNAIRVSNKAGSGFDTFIINFINEFAKYVYSKPELNIVFDVYTLYPQHFPEVKKENIKQVKLPFFTYKAKNISLKNDKNKNKNFLTPTYYLLPTIRSTLADYFRMFWTQLIFTFRMKKYDIGVALTEYDGVVFCCKQLVIVHSVVPFLFPKFPTKYRFYISKLLPYILRKCKKIITVSNVLKSEISTLFNISLEKIDVIYEGIDQKNFYPEDVKKIEDFKKQYQINKDYILIVGHSHPVKNFKGTISAFQILQKKYKIDLVIAGYVEKKIKFSYGIKYISHVPNTILRILYSGAKCFIFPSLYEGFGLPPLEAMSCGCPVVVSDKGSLPEICGDAAVYVDPYDPQDIANGILKVLTDENLREKLIKKGFEQAKKFTWQKSVIRFLNFIENF